MDNLIKLVPSSGMVLTTWNEGDDITTFDYLTEVLCNKTADITVWHLMDKAEAEAKAEEAVKTIEQRIINAEVIEVASESGATSGATIEVVE